MDKRDIKVVVRCATFNHNPYIRECLDGILMQQTNFRYVAVVHDDCSTDGTTAIVREYADKYPDIIIPMFETENQWSKHDGELDKLIDRKVASYGAKYAGFCEGDDYWTDPLKLQKQYDFMESHPEYSICFHGCSVLIQTTGEIREYTVSPNIKIDKENGYDVDFFDCVSSTKGGGQPLTMFYPIALYDIGWQDTYTDYRDTHTLYLMLKHGKGRMMNFDGGVYRKHSGGVSTSATWRQSCMEERKQILELYEHNREDCELRDYLCDILLWNYDSFFRANESKTFWQIWFAYCMRVPNIAIKVWITICKRTIKRWMR